MLINFCLSPFSNAQFEMVGSKELGRIFEVTYDPQVENKLYAITLSNHILSSTDNGQTWEIFRSLPQGYFNHVKNNLKIYDESHLTYHLKSNGSLGRTVHLLNFTTNEVEKQYTTPDPNVGGESWVNSYSISPQDKNYAIISVGYPLGFGAAEKTYYTTNGGNSWSLIYDSTLNLDIIPAQVAIHPTNPQKLYMTMGNGPTNTYGGLRISEDGGQNWTVKLPGIVLDPITFHPENPNEIWMGTGISSGNSAENLYKSLDGGNTWNIVNLDWHPYVLDCINVIKFQPNNPNQMLVLEDDEVAISNDGGNTWELIVYPDAWDMTDNYSYGLNASFNPFNENEVFISGNYYPMFSSDKGFTMERVKIPYFHADGSVNIFSKNGENHLYYGAQFGIVHKNLNTSEEGIYDILPLNFMTNDSRNALFIDPHTTGRIFTFSGGFMGYNLNVSNDFGQTKEYLHSTFNRVLNDVKPISNANDKIWASFSNGEDSSELVKIDFSDLFNVQVDELSLPNSSGAITSILFPEANDNVAFVAKGSRVHKSTNAGQSWTQSSEGLQDLDEIFDVIFKLTQNPFAPNQFSLASSNGIYTSTNSGETWTQLNQGVYQNLIYSPIQENVMVIAAHDSEASEFQIQVTKNGGESWTALDDESFMHLMTAHVISSTDFFFYEHFVDIYVATSGLGVIKYTLDLDTLSIIEVSPSLQNELMIYPNPTKDIFNIYSQENVRQVDVYSMAGQKLNQFQNTKNINISHLNSGVYLIKITLDNGKVVSQKVIRK